MSNRRSIAAHLDAYVRGRDGCSSADVARRFGMAPSNWSAYKAGRREPSETMLRRWSKACGVEITITMAGFRLVEV